MWHLRRAGEGNASGRGIKSCVGATRFHRRRILAVRAGFNLDDLVRRVPGCVEVRRFHLAFKDDVARRFGMHLRCAGFERRTCVGHRCGIVDRYFDLIGDILGFFFACRDDRSDRFAGKANDAVCEDRLTDPLIIELVQHRRDCLHAFEVSGGDHHRTFGASDAFNLSSRDSTAHEADPMGRGQVGREPSLARDQGRVFQSPDRASNPGHARAFGVRGHAASLIRSRKRGPRATKRSA